MARGGIEGGGPRGGALGIGARPSVGPALGPSLGPTLGPSLGVNLGPGATGPLSPSIGVRPSQSFIGGAEQIGTPTRNGESSVEVGFGVREGSRMRFASTRPALPPGAPAPRPVSETSLSKDPRKEYEKLRRMGHVLIAATSR